MPGSLHGVRCAAVAVLAMLVAGVFCTRAAAAELVVGLAEPNASMDPHSPPSPASFNVAMQVFEGLVRLDKDGRPQPWLAESVEAVNDTTWLLRLRKGVKWHDGTAFTADDATFSLRRGASSPTGLRSSLRHLKELLAVNPQTVRLVTDIPCPDLPIALASVLIASKRHGEAASGEDYDNGRNVIGTGPYSLVSFAPGSTTVLERYADYWGKKPSWERITYRVIPNETARVAGLMAGDVDVIENVPLLEIDKLRKARMGVWSARTGRVVYLMLDASPEAVRTGKIAGLKGETLDRNPLADLKVRQALRDAIDVEALIKRHYQGEAEVAGQFIPEGFPGHNGDLKPRKSDPARVKKLLEEAGWVGKFKLEISTASGFFPLSAAVTETIAQSWTRAGIPTTLVNSSVATWVAALRERKLPVIVGAFQNTAKSADSFFPSVARSRDNARHLGTLNLIGYSNAEVDALVDDAMATMNKDRRGKLWADVSRKVVDDEVIIPLLFLNVVHASRPNIAVEMRADRAILGENVQPRAANQ